VNKHKQRSRATRRAANGCGQMNVFAKMGNACMAAITKQWASFKAWLRDGGITFQQSDVYVLLKALSVVAAAMLVVAGAIGTSAIFSLDIKYFVGSIYAAIFGFGILALELKGAHRRTAAVYTWYEQYLKFLTVQRAKGLTYVCISLLIFCIGPKYDTSKQWMAPWGFNNVAAIVLASAGVLHMAPKFKKVTSDAPSFSDAPTFSSAGDDQIRAPQKLTEKALAPPQMSTAAPGSLESQFSIPIESPFSPTRL